MCIIATKPQGKALFSDETIEQMFVRNSDGAGYMYVDHGRVRIRKGFMKLVDLKQSLASLGDVTDIPMIFHFRITTHGGTSPSNCHPFPVTSVVSFLQAEKVICDLGMVHNGIIKTVTPRAGISDTMEYILQVVDPLRKLNRGFYLQEDGLKILETTCGSKLAFLDGKGRIITVGKFIEDDGYSFSNDSYKPRPKPVYKVTTPINYDDDYPGYERWWINSKKDKDGIARVNIMPVPKGSFILTADKDDPSKVIEICLDPITHGIDSMGDLYEIDDACVAHKLTSCKGERIYKEDGMRVWYAWGKTDSIILGEDY